MPRGARAAWDGHRAGTAARAPPLTPAAAAHLPRDCCRAESCCRFYHASLSKCCYQPWGWGETANGQQCLKPLGCPWRQGEAEMAAEGINVTWCWQQQPLNLQLSLPSCKCMMEGGNGGLETRHRGTLKGQSGACLPARGFNLQIRQNCPSSRGQHFCIWAARAGVPPLSRIPRGARLLWMLRASPSPGLNLPWEPRKPKGQEGACSSTAGGGTAEEHFTRGFVLYFNKRSPATSLWVRRRAPNSLCWAGEAVVINTGGVSCANWVPAPAAGGTSSPCIGAALS